MKTIGIINGSTRTNSYSGQIINNLVGLISEDYKIKHIQINDLPLYSQDYDTLAPTPKEYERLRKEVLDVDAIIFVTPEHNRSISAALKNALDIGSRPPGNNVWAKKPALIIAQSPGQIGGFGAAQALKQILHFFNMRVMNTPEVYIARSASLLDENGKIINESTLNFLNDVLNSFLVFINE
ncbi:MAG: NAD(P)H-dependent oxidoreductase [Erysipelotrichaceae bacterium]|nr:NAD(P)H-dependent oxidoreductase [Erysipelotrichaceae bacterium]